MSTTTTLDAANDADTARPQTDQGIVVSRESPSEDFDVYTVTGLAKPPDFDSIASRNSAALETLMKKS